tara:strand:+ start:23753 stop:24094 length:342 start_codon:yes stop_codon:yes gene_type:complete
MHKVAKIFYQKNFNLYGMGSDVPLQIDPEMSVRVGNFRYDEDAFKSRQEVCQKIFTQQNTLNVPPGHPERPIYEKAQHTSMSVGDYVIFYDGEIWICDTMGWKVLTAAWKDRL